MYTTWLLFSFRGRINRVPFWLFTIAAAVAIYVGGGLIADFADLPFSVGVDLAAAILLLPALAVQTKRWHDRNKSGWWLLLNLVPIVGAVWVLVECGLLDGTRGGNAYGADPLGRNGGSGRSLQSDETPRTSAGDRR